MYSRQDVPSARPWKHPLDHGNTPLVLVLQLNNRFALSAYLLYIYSLNYINGIHLVSQTRSTYLKPRKYGQQNRATFRIAMLHVAAGMLLV